MFSLTAVASGNAIEDGLERKLPLLFHILLYAGNLQYSLGNASMRVFKNQLWECRGGGLGGTLTG